MTDVSGGTYTGMANGAGAVWIGRASSSYAKGSIRDCKIFNRELTASEVAELARGNDLGFSEQWGGALGDVYSSDFSAGAQSWLAINGTADGNIDDATSGTGEDDTLRLTCNTTSGPHYLYWAALPLTAGKRYRISLDYYIPSTNSNLDGIAIGNAFSPTLSDNSATLDAWTRLEGDVLASVQNTRIYGADGGALSFQDTGGDDVMYIKNITVTEIGTLADFRAEDYNESASKLLDRSSNNFVGVGTSVTLTGNQRHISADTIDLKNLPTSSAGLSAGEVWSNGGVLTVV